MFLVNLMLARVDTSLTIGTSIDSALATFVCKSSPCQPDPNDTPCSNASGLNAVVFETPSPEPIEFYVTIYGCGKYKQLNYYRFGVNIEEINSLLPK